MLLTGFRSVFEIMLLILYWTKFVKSNCLKRLTLFLHVRVGTEIVSATHAHVSRAYLQPLGG